jgi:hypothetical protein
MRKGREEKQQDGGRRGYIGFFFSREGETLRRCGRSKVAGELDLRR